MHRPLATSRTFTPILAVLATASSFAACAPWDLGEESENEVPEAGRVVMSKDPPPAISGGTLAVSRDGGIAIAADPDRDRVWVVDLKAQKLSSEIALQKGDEPGRVVEDGAGRFHVALRRGGAVVTIDAAAGKITDRREVCSAPRGVAYDADADALHVACLGGELVTLPAAGGAATRKLRLDRDLRDVVVDGDKLLVSTFRAAELLTVTADGTVANRRKPQQFQMFGQQFEPSVAWRMVKLPSGGVAVAHQRAMVNSVVIQEGGYSSGGCDSSIVHSTVSKLGATAGENPSSAPAALPFASLPVDLAVSADGNTYAIVAAGTDEVILINPSLLNTGGFGSPTDGGFGGPEGGDFGGEGACANGDQRTQVSGEPTAVAFAGNSVLVQTREPASLQILGGATITLPGESRMDTGHEMFHKNENGAMVCASCHPEGSDDGRVWNFDPIGPRRTQYVSGGILQTAPFHWDGDMDGIDTIMSEVFEHRMSGIHQGPRRVRIFERWLDSLPAVPVSPAADAVAVTRGDALFHDKTVGCASCHAGDHTTNNEAREVGTGKAFQVPSLVRISAHGPFMHDGCAATLRDRFTNPACGGGDRHGTTSQLSETQIDDLVAYLETL